MGTVYGKRKNVNGQYAREEPSNTTPGQASPSIDAISSYLMYWRWVFSILAAFIAYECNKSGSYILTCVVAFLFPEIYFGQFFIRRYIFQEPNYCVVTYT